MPPAHSREAEERVEGEEVISSNIMKEMNLGVCAMAAVDSGPGIAW